MIPQRPRIIVGDARFEDGTSPQKSGAHMSFLQVFNCEAEIAVWQAVCAYHYCSCMGLLGNEQKKVVLVRY